MCNVFFLSLFIKIYLSDKFVVPVGFSLFLHWLLLHFSEPSPNRKCKIGLDIWFSFTPAGRGGIKYKCQTIWLFWPFFPLPNCQIGNWCDFTKYREKLTCKVVKCKMLHTQYMILNIFACNLCCRKAILHIGVIYMRYAVTLSTKKRKKPANLEIRRKENVRGWNL